MSMFNELKLQPILAVLTKLQVQLQLDSKEKRAIDYALWDLAYHYHSCTGLTARFMIQVIFNATYFIPGLFLDSKQKRDILAYALAPENTSKEALLHYRVKFNDDDEHRLRRVVLPNTTQNATQTEISQPNDDKNVFDLRWVLDDFKSKSC